MGRKQDYYAEDRRQALACLKAKHAIVRDLFGDSPAVDKVVPGNSFCQTCCAPIALDWNGGQPQLCSEVK